MNRVSILAVLSVVAGMLLTSCSTDSHTRKASLMNRFLPGNITEARQIAYELRSNGPAKDRVINALEEGHLAFLDGDFAAARSAFVYAESEIANMDQRAIVSATEVGDTVLSNLKNLDALEYRASCRDRIMLHVFKALSYLGMGNTAAYNTEVFPMHQLMQDIEVKYMDIFEKEAASVQNSLAASSISQDVNSGLSAVPDVNSVVSNTAIKNFLNPLALLMAGLARAEADDWETAKVDFNKLYLSMPQSLVAGQLVREVLRREGQPIPAPLASLPEPMYNLEDGSVLVIFANGRGASLEQRTIDSPVLHAAFPIPALYSQTVFPYMTVTADNVSVATETIADMDGMALFEYRLGYTQMMVRTAISAIIKEGLSAVATAAAYEAFRDDGPSHHRPGPPPHHRPGPPPHHRDNLDAEIAAGIVWGVTDAYKRAVNIADTRMWETLPSKYQVALLPIPADHRVTMSLSAPNGVTAAEAVIPEGARSAIIYVNATGCGAFRHMVFPKQ